MSASTSGTPHPPPLQPAVLARRYRLERRLAQGGMAEVWLGTDTLLSRNVAIKLLKPGLASDPTVAERFRREAIAAASLNHPNIVDVYDAVEEEINGFRRQAVVMQLVNGKSLRDLLDDKKRLSAELTMHIGSCVAAALDAAHKANLVHRDVKPGNILVTPDGRVLLTDFGIAKALSSTDDDDLTSPNVMMGTAKYLSPEQVRGHRLDGRADLYSLGLVLYECLAGRVPFLGETDTDTALARLNREPTDLNRLRPTLPHGLAHVIHNLLAKKPEQRYATGALVRAELSKVSAQPNPGAGDYSTGFTPPHIRTPGRDPGLERGAGRESGRESGRGAGRGSSSPVRPARQSDVDDPRRQPSRRDDGDAGQHRSGRPAGSPVRLDRGGSGARDQPATRVDTDRARHDGVDPGHVRPSRPVIDRTPTNAARPRQQPNRQFDQPRSRSGMIVVLLLVVAAIVTAVLWQAVGDDADDGDGAVNDGGVLSVPLVSQDSIVAQSPPVGAPGIVGLVAFDPEGTDPSENDGELDRATDDDSTTGWSTLCYGDRFLGGKPGVGIVADLGQPTSGTLTASIASAPFNVRIYTSAASEMPATYSGWGDAVTSDSDDEPGSMSVGLDGTTRWVLVSFVELGESDACSTDNPFRGVITELTLTP